MKRAILLFLSITAGFGTQAQSVTNVDYYQSGKQIVVTYSLDKTANISVFCSTDGGSTFGSALKRVTGDVGSNVAPGSKSLTWDVLAETEKLTGDNIVFKVQSGSPFICEMVYVDGGTFMMGATPEQGDDADTAAKPVCQVTVSGFYIGKYEVTQAQWQSVMGSNPSSYKGVDQPVTSVSFDDIQVFLRTLNAQTGGNYRLPTEAEWEYAARGGSRSQGYKCSGGNKPGLVGWWKGNSEDEAHPVGQKTPNELGIYDMTGNVGEICQDWYVYGYSSSAQIDPTGPLSGAERIVRGGDYYDEERRTMVSYRSYIKPGEKRSWRGFRLACD